MSFTSTQTRVEFRPDGCQYRTVLRETCRLLGDGRRDCERTRRVFRRCPGDRDEVEIEATDSTGPADLEEHRPTHPPPPSRRYDGRATTV